MEKNIEEIKGFIFDKNNLSGKEKEIVSPFVDYFFDTEVMDLNKFNLDIYKKFINVKNKKEIDNDFLKIENLDKASLLFAEYIKAKKPIYIITDNDLDGTSANAIAKAVKLYIDRKYKRKDIFRVDFAYGANHGISFQQIQDIIEDPNEDALIITADNGINNKLEIEEIKNKYKNIKIIITDHHKANEGENVFGLADLIINPEAINEEEVSITTQLNIDNLGEVKTSMSGGHTFYVLMKKTLEHLKVNNVLLDREILLIALFSDIGDLINYHLDVYNDIALNLPYFEKDMYLLKNYINGLDKFSILPDKLVKEKILDYFNKTLPTFNSIRRLNSLLMSIKDFEDNEDNIINWFKDNFELEVSEIKINDYNLDEYLKKTNKKAKEILEYFGEPLDKKHNFYSAIKNIVPYALLSSNALKTKEDEIFIQEIIDIINDFNEIKKKLRLHLINNDLYSAYKKDNIEIYCSKLGSILREILTIQVFIEKGENIPYINVAENKTTNEIKGSLRTPSFFPLKQLLLENEEVNKIKQEMDLEINIVGHNEAAGISFSYKNNKEKEIFIETVYEFIDKIEPIIDSIMAKNQHKIKDSSIEIKLEDLAEITPNKLQFILNNYLYIANHPFIVKPSFEISLSDIKSFFEVKDNEKIQMAISKKGNKFLNKSKNGVVILYYGEEEKLTSEKEEYFTASFEFKYKKETNRFNIELTLN